MVRIYNADLDKVAAWPRSTLHESNGAVRGFLMPRIVDHKELHILYGPQSRRREFPKATWAFLAHVAMNCAAAFDSVHSKGAVIADVNARNILVSGQAMVRLVDCDSFQIVSGAERYLSEVGVPDYTPPELQGVPFAGVVRSANHDCFGLAVVIFHLLFMGRHPFFGAFTGRGDMPPDQAIKEFRFVYGAEGFKKQMRAPPHSLPLHFVTPEVGNLFELAFSKQGARADRPSAARWMRALKDMTSTLKTCSVDETHKFPSTATACAWCEISNKGGPTFFYSANLPLTFECAATDLDETLAKLHQVEVRASAPPPRPTVHSPPTVPRSLPAEAVASRIPWPFTTIAFGIASVFTAIAGGVAITNESETAGAGIIVGLAVLGVITLWRAWFTHYSLFGTERASRVNEADAAKAELTEVSRLRIVAEQVLRRRLLDVKTRVTAIRQAYATLKPAYESELQHAERNAESEQRRAFLDSVELRTATISNVGDTRKANLRAYGFESALDVLQKDPSIVPGIGEMTARNLRSWAQSEERRFKFDPKKGLPPAQRQALVTRFRTQKSTMFGALQAALSEAERSVTDAEAEQLQLVARLEKALARDAQARLDVLVTGEPSRRAIPLTLGASFIVMLVVAAATRPRPSQVVARTEPAAPVADTQPVQSPPPPPPPLSSLLTSKKNSKKATRKATKSVPAPAPAPTPTATAPMDPYAGTSATSSEAGSSASNGSAAMATDGGETTGSTTASDPETLNPQLIASALEQIGPRLDACYSENPAPGEIRFRMRVRPDGHVAAVSIVQAISTSLAECVSDALRSASFRVTEKGGVFTHSVTLPR